MDSMNKTDIHSLQRNGSYFYFMQENEGDVEKILWEILPPVFLAFGTLGNIICGKMNSHSQT